MLINNFKKYVKKAIPLEKYKTDIEEVIKEGKHDLSEYYKLNKVRMNRLDKTLKLKEEQKFELNRLKKPMILLIITEGWCGDASHIIPMVEKMVEFLPNTEAKILYRDDNQELMNNYLTRGAKSIPIIIAVDTEKYEEIFRWGPRPQWGEDLLKSYKLSEISKEKFQETLQKKYNSDKGQSVYREITDLIKSA